MLTKDELQKLPVEEQEILARMVLNKAQHREKLVERARGRDWLYRYFPLYVLALYLIFAAFYYFNFLEFQSRPAVWFLPVGTTFVFMLINLGALNSRRLDAVMDLLELDRQERETSRIQTEKH